MSRNWARIFGGVLAVVIIWIAAYWWLNPAQPPISFGTPDTIPVNRPPTLQRQPITLAELKRPSQPFESDPPHSAPFTPEPRPEASSSPSLVVAEPLASTATPPSAAPAPPPAIIPPKFSDYTIQRGDSLSSIAQAKLGGTRHIDAIRRSNPFKDLDKLKPGDVIRLPADPTNIQGKPIEGAPTPAPPPDRQGEMLEYTVKSGDTLSKIAKAKYGSTTYQDLIFRANRDRLKSPGSLKEGQKLRLPKKP